MNNVAYFEIQSENPKKLADFYGKIFDWEIHEDKNLPIEYFRIKTEGMNGGILKRPTKTPPMEMGTNAFTNSMQVANFDETAKIILENGGIVAMEKFAIPGTCWQGYFVDLDHNVFGIFEVDPEAK